MRSRERHDLPGVELEIARSYAVSHMTISRIKERHAAP
jgi:hypothetical protein